MPRRSSGSDSDSYSESESASSDGSYRKSSTHGKVKKDKKSKKDKKDKKSKIKKDKKSKETHISNSSSDPRYQTSHTSPKPQLPPGYIAPIPPMSFPEPGTDHEFRQGHATAPPPDYGSTQSFYHASPPPPSGYRIPLTGGQQFPNDAQLGHPPTYDLDGTPVYIGSALKERSVHPCKIVPNLNPPARVPYAGSEEEHWGRFDVLPYIPEQMEWIPASKGLIPEGRRAVEGGYEEDGAQLYHGMLMIDGVRVPGKVGRHLDGCNAPFAGQEHHGESYELLVWKRY